MAADGAAGALTRTGISLLLLGAGAAIWELFAQQAPESPFHVGVLPGPVGSLHTTAVTIGLLLAVASMKIPGSFPSGLHRGWVIGAVTGAVLVVGAATYAALTGMHGVQIVDPRLDAQLLLVARVLGFAVLATCLTRVAIGVLRRPS